VKAGAAIALAMLMAGTACANPLRQHPTRPVPAPPPIKVIDDTFPRPADYARIHFVVAAKNRQDAIDGAENEADDMTICYALLAMHTTFDASTDLWTCELIADIPAPSLGSYIHVLI
jgi:hypothetical protein